VSDWATNGAAGNGKSRGEEGKQTASDRMEEVKGKKKDRQSRPVRNRKGTADLLDGRASSWSARGLKPDGEGSRPFVRGARIVFNRKESTKKRDNQVKESHEKGGRLLYRRSRQTKECKPTREKNNT